MPQCIAYYCYTVNEKLLIACGTNRALSNLATKVLDLLPKPEKKWNVPDSAKGVYRLETELDESFDQIDRNAKAYQHTFPGDYEAQSQASMFENLQDQPISDTDFRYVEEYVKRRIHTGRPLSLGDHIIERLRKARAEYSKPMWTHDEYTLEESRREYELLWQFLALRQAAVRHRVFYVELIGETTPQRQARAEELDNTQKAIVRDTSKAWRNLQSFYIKHARMVLVTDSQHKLLVDGS